jgi:arginyl-tRNA synthetase
MHSLLQKGKENNFYPGLKMDNHGVEKVLERKVFQFESVLKEVVDELAPQKLVTYLFELSGVFNSFYNENKILDLENKYLTEHYLFVVQKTLNTLTKGLNILGIKAPEKM